MSFEYLLKTNYLSDSSPDSWENAINSISLPDIVGQHNYAHGNKITNDAVEKLKIITKKGFNFYDGKYNLVDLYLCEINHKYTGRKLIDGVENFIDWLLENYPNNYSLCKDVLTDELKKKYNYLENSNKYNL